MAASLCWAPLLVTLWLLATAHPAAAAAMPGSGRQQPSHEEVIMLKLRQVVHEARSVGERPLVPLPGWHPSDAAHPCSWAHVTCDAQGRITAVAVFDGIAKQQDPAAPVPGVITDGRTPVHPSSQQQQQLPPELAQLQWLESFEVDLPQTVLISGIPPEYGMPEAFPRLQRLKLRIPNPGPALPDIQPGALPVLADMVLQFVNLVSPLPASWGSSPLTLPALESLELVLLSGGQLPPEWGSGFPRLTHLVVSYAPQTAVERHSARAAAGSSMPAAAVPPPLMVPQDAPRYLPPEWATGFRNLSLLNLFNHGLEGTLPNEWVDGGFPSITNLRITYTNLTGPLPPQLFETHPLLRFLSLEANQFSGTLPAAWASSKAVELWLALNNLTGPAFPPAWIQPGALSQLEQLSIVGQPRLTGTLPAQLSWPKLTRLHVGGTAVDGRIPDSWCSAPFNSSLNSLGICQSGVVPTLPACAETHLPMLLVDVDREGLEGCESKAATSAERQDAAIALPVVLPIGMVTLAGVLGVFAWRLQQRAGGRRRGSRGRPLQGGFSRLQPAAGGDAAAATTTAGRPAAVDSVQPEARQPSSRQARIAARLELELGGHTVDLAVLPPEELPATLAHRMQPDGGGGGGGGAWPPAGGTTPAPAPGPPTQHQPLPAATSAGGSNAGSQAGLQSELEVRYQQRYQHQYQADEAATESARLLAHGGEHGTSDAIAAAEGWPIGPDAYLDDVASRQPSVDVDGSASRQSILSLDHLASRQWAIDAHSLRVLPAQLEFVSDSTGSLVVLGEGSQAVVYLARLHGVDVAVKVFELLPGMESDAIWREVSLLRQCTHDRIVPLYGLAVKGQLLMLTMRLMHGGSLLAALLDPEKQQQLRWGVRGAQVAIDVAEAVDYLHTQRRIMHSDLKSSNVLLSGELRASISDLGVARRLCSTTMITGIGGSRLYAAPEQLMGQRCTLAADIYSLGLVFIELLTQQQIAVRGNWRLPSVPEECPQAVADLISDCISPDPHQRPSAAQALCRLCDAAS